MLASILRVVARPLPVVSSRGTSLLITVKPGMTTTPWKTAKYSSFYSPKYKNVPKQDQGDHKSEVNWLWEASREQMIVAEGHQRGTRWMVLGWRLSSSYSLGHEFFDSLVEILNSKVRPLRGIVKFRLRRPWVCESCVPLRDVQFLGNADPETVKKEVGKLCNTEMMYDRTPLWKLLITPGEQVSFSPFCSLYTHEYDVYFRFYHAFLDYTTMVYTLHWFANVIHQASIGHFIEARSPWGFHVRGQEVEGLMDTIKDNFKVNPNVLELKEHDMKSCHKTPLLLEAFPPPGGPPYSKHVHRCLAPGAFKRFVDQCQGAGVTVSSGLQAAINTGLVELVRDAGVTAKTYSISVTWNSDLRRFISPQQLGVLGFHQTPVVQLMQTPSNVRETFWPYAKKVDEQVHLSKVSGEDLQQKVVSELVGNSNPEDYYSTAPYPLVDYAYIYAGNFNAFIPPHSEQFSVSDVYMMSSVHKSPYVVCHQMNLYNGAFFYSLSYDSSYVAGDIADLWMERVMSIIENL